MKKRGRLSGTERRAGIIDSARRVFADKGFRGTTTRELAGRAGVSEALLFKHFPSKEALYTAMLEHCMASEAGLEYQRILALPPSTSSLAMLLHFIAAKVIVSGDPVVRSIHQLILHSMGEDGAFAKIMFKSAEDDLIPSIRACLQAARKCGDLVDGASGMKDAEWLTQHVLLMLSFMHLPKTPLVKYRAEPSRRVEEAVLFVLRGMGVREDAIARAYNPRALALFETGKRSHTASR